MSEKEKWKSIPGFSRYEASSFGRLRSINYKNSGKTKVLKPALSDGYLKTMLQADNRSYKTWNVHKFIAITWLGKCAKGFVVNHKDGIKINCRPSNLEYVTISENVQHSYDNGLQKPALGSKNSQHKLTESDVIAIRAHADSSGRYYGRKALAAKYKVTEGHIKDIVTRRRNPWPHV